MTLKFKRYVPLFHDDPDEYDEGTTDKCPEIEAIFDQSPHVLRVTIEMIGENDTSFAIPATFVYERDNRAG